MQKDKQKAAFLEYEADAWFERNKTYLTSYSPQNDEVIKLMTAYELNPASVLEIGSSAGHRLNGIKTIYPLCQVYGIEPSKKAIAFGQTTYQGVELINGTADNLKDFEDASLDLVIVGFMLYVIDRDILFRVFSEINRVLKNGGFVILVDFFAQIPSKNIYQHIQRTEAFSYKQNYEEMFTASRLFFLLDKSTQSHHTGKRDVSIDYNNNYTISLLKKDLDAGYK